MSDIISEINARIEKAESAKKKAEEELAKLKGILAKNDIVVKDNKVFVFLGVGRECGWHCYYCPLGINHTEETECSIHRSSLACVKKGGRFFSMPELREFYKEHEGKEMDNFDTEEKLSNARAAFREIIKTANSAISDITDKEEDE